MHTKPSSPEAANAANPMRRRRALIVTAILLVLAILASGTYAFIDRDQHDTNIFKGKDFIDVTLNDKFIPPTNWEKDVDVDKKVSVTNNLESLQAAYIRLQFKEYFEYATWQPVQDGAGNDLLFATWASGSLIGKFMLWDEKPADYDYVRYTVDGVDYCLTQNAELKDGIYGKKMYIKTALTVFGDAPKAPYPMQPHEGQDDTNPECNYDVAEWTDVPARSGNITAPNSEAIIDYIAWTLGDTVISMAEWKANGMLLGDFWVVDTDGWVYWANPLRPGDTTSNVLESVRLLQNPGGSEKGWEFEYYIHIDMDAVSKKQLAKRDWDNDEGTNTDLIDRLLETDDTDIPEIDTYNADAYVPMSGSLLLAPQNLVGSVDFSGPDPAIPGVTLAPSGLVSVGPSVPFGTRFTVTATQGLQEEIIKCEVVLPINATYFPDAAFRAKMIAHAGHPTDSSFFTITEANNMRTIDVQGESSTVRGNIVSLTGIEYFKKLTAINFQYNKVAAFDASEHPALVSLYANYNNLASVNVSNNPELRSLQLYSNILTSLDVTNNTALTYLTCAINSIDELDVTHNTNLTFLSCRSNNLDTLDISNNTALETLHCFSNPIGTLDVTNHTALKELLCSSNELLTLDVSNCTELITLSCNDNQLTSLNVSNNTALRELRCYTNQISTLDVTSCLALTLLMCHNNPPLSALNVSNNTALTYLNCSLNPLITALDVSSNTALTYLNCRSNNLTTLDVSNNTALTNLYCYTNNLTTLVLTGIPGLSNGVDGPPDGVRMQPGTITDCELSFATQRAGGTCVATW